MRFDLNVIDIFEIKGKYGFDGDDIFCYIGKDEKIYINSTDYKNGKQYPIICLTVDWYKNNNVVLDERVIELYKNFNKVYSIFPISNNYLVIGNCIEDQYRSSDKKENAKYCYIVDINGDIRHMFYLGWLNMKTIHVDSNNRIVVGYYDEGIFGDYRMRSGLVVFDEFGNRIWENKKYNIHECYSLNIDNNDNIWFSPNWKLLVKVNWHDDSEYSVFNVGSTLPDLTDVNGILLSNKQDEIIISAKSYGTDIEKYYHLYQSSKAYIDEDPCEFYTDGKMTSFRHEYFRNTKALFWNDDKLAWFDYRI